MAEVQAQPRPHKQKVGSLDGFLAGHGSSTHAAREDKARNGGVPHPKSPKSPKRSGAKNSNNNNNKADDAELLLNVCKDVAIDALLTAAKNDELHNSGVFSIKTDGTNNSKRTKPRTISGKKKGDPLNTGSCHIPRPSALTNKDRSSSQPLESSKKKGARGPLPRSQSFHNRKDSSADGKDATTAVANGSRPAKLERRKSHREVVTRSKSFDGDTPMTPLKRIPRNPPRTSLTDCKSAFPRNPPRRASSEINMEEKRKRASSKEKPHKSNSTGTNTVTGTGTGEEGTDAAEQQQSSSQHERKSLGEKQGSQRRVKRTSSKEKDPVGAKKTTTGAKRRSKSGTRDNNNNNKASTADKETPKKSSKSPSAAESPQAFSPGFGEEEGNASVAPFETAFDVDDNNNNNAAMMTPSPRRPSCINQHASNAYDEEDEEDETTCRDYDDDAAPAGIMQFDPSAMNNVKICRGDSVDEFPSDMPQVDMGLGDIVLDDGENNDGDGHHHESDARRARSHSPYRNTNSNNPGDDVEADADKKAGRWGAGFSLKTFKLKKSNSFKFSKSGHGQQDDDTEQQQTTATAMYSGAMRLMGMTATGHQQLDDSNMDDSMMDNLIQNR